MVEKMFLQVLNMSFTASFVIILVLIARLLLKKSPKFLSYALWGVVLFRLICPFSFESMFSLLPVKSNPIPLNIVYEAIPTIDTGIPAINHTVNQSLPAAIPTASINPLQIWTFIGSAVWLMGMAILVIYSVLSLMKLQKCLKNAIHEKDNIYLAKHLDTPFVMGFIRPKIHLPASITEEEKRYILLHEQMHIKRFDHVIKLVSFFVLCLHWFNPFVWIAFFISSKDMEMSCDEAVVKQLGSDVKKEYSSSLLTLATGKRIIGGGPLAFGEGDTKGRIKNVLNYKKPAFWMVILSLILCIILAGCLISNPKTHSNASDFSIKTDNIVVELGSPDILPLDILGTKEIVNEMTGEILVLEDYDGFSITRDSQHAIINIEILSDNVYTYRNITIGSNRSDLLLAYPEIIPEEQKLKALWFEDQNSIIEFYFSDDYDIVSAIKIYRKMSNDDLPMPAVSLEELWSARTKYVGDNSAVGKLLGLLPLPQNLHHDHFELLTDEKQRGIKWFLKGNDNFLEYTGLDPMAPSALLLFTLVDNLEDLYIIRAHPDENETKNVRSHYNRLWAEEQIGNDIRVYAKSPEKLQELFTSYNVNQTKSLTQDQAVALALTSSSNYYLEGECFGEGHIILGADKKGNTTKIYALTMTGHYGFQNNNFVKVSGTGVIPAVVMLIGNNDVSIEYPKDGSYHASSIKKMFPSKYHNRIFADKENDRKTLKKQEQIYAKEYLSKIGRKAEIGDYSDFEHILLTDLGVSVEVSNKLGDFYKEHSNYPYFIGTQEYIENNLRIVYRMSYNKNQNKIKFTKYTYDSEEILEQFIMNATTGDSLAPSESAP